MRQLQLDRDKVEECYKIASLIYSHARKYIERHSSSSIEKATLKLMGLRGEKKGKSFAHWVVNSLTKDQLRLGGAYWWGRALIGTKLEPENIVSQIFKRKWKWETLPDISLKEIQNETKRLCDREFKGMASGFLNREKKTRLAASLVFRSKGVLGDILKMNKDGVQDFRLRLNRQNWNEEGEAALVTKDFLEMQGKCAKESFSLTPELVGVNVPETTVSLLQKGVSSIAIDGLVNSLLFDVDLRRSLADQYFSLRLLHRFDGSVRMTVAKWIRKRNEEVRPDIVLALLLLQEQLVKSAGFDLENLNLSYRIPERILERKGVLGGMAYAQLVREIFSQSSLDIGWDSRWGDSVAWIASLTDHNGWEFAIEEGEKKWKAIRNKIEETLDLKEEIVFNTHGKISRVAHAELEAAHKLLKYIHHINLWKAFEEKKLDPSLKSLPQAGMEGIFQLGFHYWNPLLDGLLQK